MKPDAGTMQRLDDLKHKADELQITEERLLIQLAEIRTSKSYVRAELAELTNSIAPIIALPNEVLVEIFSHLDGGWRHGLPFLVEASHVIRKWRTVALSSPGLWSKIELRPKNRSRQYEPNLIEEYLSRSHTWSLDIFVFMCEEQDPLPIITLILPHIHRWQRLVIESSDEIAVHGFMRSLRNQSAPSLGYFQVDLEIDDEQDESLWEGDNWTLGGGVPALSFVGLRGINLQRWLPPLQAVKSVYLADCYSATMLSYARFREILKASASLTHLELEGMINCSPRDDLTLIEMPHLVSLSVLPPDYVNPMHYMHNIFTAIKAPALKTLCLRKVYGQQFRTFLETFRSASWHPVLQTLQLESVTGLEYLTHNFALSSPTITHLSLKFTDPKPILKLLLSNKEDPLWPQLKILTLGTDHGGLLRTVISERIAVGRPLLQLRLATESQAAFDNLPANEMDWLRERLTVKYVSFYDM